MWRPECIGHVREPAASGLKVTVYGCIFYRGVSENAGFCRRNYELSNTLKRFGSIWTFVRSDHWNLREYNASIHKYAPLTHGTDNAQCQLYRSRHSYQYLSPIGNVWSVPKKKETEKKNRMFRSSTNKELEHVAKIQVALNELCGKSEFF